MIAILSSFYVTDLILQKRIVKLLNFYFLSFKLIVINWFLQKVWRWSFGLFWIKDSSAYQLDWEAKLS